MFYDFLLCVALMMVVTLVYQQGILRLIYGSEHLRELADRGALIGDPLLSTLLVFALFGFFAKFWTHNGQTLGMQVGDCACRTATAAPSACSRRCCAS